MATGQAQWSGLGVFLRSADQFQMNPSGQKSRSQAFMGYGQDDWPPCVRNCCCKEETSSVVAELQEVWITAVQKC